MAFIIVQQRPGTFGIVECQGVRLDGMEDGVIASEALMPTFLVEVIQEDHESIASEAYGQNIGGMRLLLRLRFVVELDIAKLHLDRVAFRLSAPP